MKSKLAELEKDIHNLEKKKNEIQIDINQKSNMLEFLKCHVEHKELPEYVTDIYELDPKIINRLEAGGIIESRDLVDMTIVDLLLVRNISVGRIKVITSVLYYIYGIEIKSGWRKATSYTMLNNIELIYPDYKTR